MKKVIICFVGLTIFLTGCSLRNSNDNNEVNNNLSKVTIETKNDTTKSDDNSLVENSNTQNSVENSEKDNLSSNDENENISEKVKDYITNGQENKPLAEQLKWSKRFLEQVDIESLYQQYIIDGGDGSDIEKIAQYVTENAAIPSNWQELFEEDLYESYGQRVSKVEPLEGDLYQVYVNKDNSDVPFVVVSSRTGYFHG